MNLTKVWKLTLKKTFFAIESLKINENVFIIRQKLSYNLLANSKGNEF